MPDESEEFERGGGAKTGTGALSPPPLSVLMAPSFTPESKFTLVSKKSPSVKKLKSCCVLERTDVALPAYAVLEGLADPIEDVDLLPLPTESPCPEPKSDFGPEIHFCRSSIQLSTSLSEKKTNERVFTDKRKAAAHQLRHSQNKKCQTVDLEEDAPRYPFCHDASEG